MYIAYSITNSTVNSINNSVNELNESMDKISGNKTEDILNNELDVNFGEFTLDDVGYGMVNTEIVVKLTNKSSESKSLSVTIKAVNEAGDRITTDTVYGSSLSAGQSYETKAFTFAGSETAEKLKTATFKVLECSSY